MRDVAETWAVVLAGGDGSRLRNLTTTREGLTVPKQYCSLGRSPCLLQDALNRARSLVIPSHICAVVAAEHRRWWTSAVSSVKESNVFIQPGNKGTAYGILLSLLKLEAINPAATVTLLPADHYFRDEGMITRMLRVAVNLATANPTTPYLLGTEPHGADSELGYILPRQQVRDKAAEILGFTEKPTEDYAKELISLGALWNIFMLVGSVASLLDMYSKDHAAAVLRMREALRGAGSGDKSSLEGLYETLRPLDFSHDVLEVQAARLQVLRVPHCGWTDLGTPRRLEATLRALANVAPLHSRPPPHSPLFLDLAAPRHTPQTSY